MRMEHGVWSMEYVWRWSWNMKYAWSIEYGVWNMEYSETRYIPRKIKYLTYFPWL